MCDMRVFCTTTRREHATARFAQTNMPCGRSTVQLGGLTALLLVLTATHAAGKLRACEESGYCSVGISRQWVGDIRDSHQFRAMLQNVAFRKEIILTIYMPEEGQPLLWLDPVHQYHQELMDMGFAHHLFVTLNKDHCDQLRLPDASCVWDSSPMPKEVLVGETALWHSRWKLMARATRLGYNVLSTDTDFIFWRDPYPHLKSGSLANAQMLCMPEGGGLHNCNGGFMYVQNARPDGPVTWVFKHVIMSTLRRADDGLEFISRYSNMKENCLTFDQALIMDSLISAAVGRPMAYNAVLQCKSSTVFTPQQGQQLNITQVLTNIRAVWAQTSRSHTFELAPDPTWLHGLGLPNLPWDDVSAVEGNLTIPNMNLGYPEELGGRVHPDSSGRLSHDFIQTLKADCPDCPWWAEERPVTQPRDSLSALISAGTQATEAGEKLPQDKLALFHDPTLPVERLVQVPRWVSSSLSITRRGTFTGRSAPVTGPFLMSHIHSWHLQTSRQHKIMLRKLLGRYDWAVGAAAARAAGVASPYALRRDVRRVLALSPAVDLSRTRSWEEAARIIVGLLQVAQLSRRTLLMPDLPCETAWLHDVYARNNPKERKKACVDYTFHRNSNALPLAVPYPVDDQDQLEGGWLRRLQATTSAISAGRAERGEGTWDKQSGAGSDVRGRRVLLGDATSSGTRPSPQSTPVDRQWWHSRRLMAAIPAYWDATCTIELRTITTPEFHHWLKADEHAATANPHPGPSNTVFKASQSEPRLQLRPPLTEAGATAPGHPRGSLILPRNDTGWSWADVQVSLPVEQVIEELRSRADVPLLYVGHPVLVVGDASTEAHAADQGSASTATESKAQRQMLMAGKAGVTQTRVVRSPGALLSRINRRLRSSACRAIHVDIESKQVVSLEGGLRAKLREPQQRP